MTIHAAGEAESGGPEAASARWVSHLLEVAAEQPPPSPAIMRAAPGLPRTQVPASPSESSPLAGSSGTDYVAAHDPLVHQTPESSARADA
jgi:hypothetical protein